MNANEMTAKALENAADNLLINGWQRNTLGSRGGAQCAAGHMNTGMEQVMGADMQTVWSDPDTYKQWTIMCQTAYGALYRATGILNKGMTFKGFGGDDYPVRDIPSWNDHIAKDEWEVRDAFLTAAKELRNSAAS
jgi:hypothetical protein